ncbi:Bifunctional protein PutA [Phycisphaerae bacterium RAS2]|nr:Bifunctional protein PutA [Phycisphaerae bacterium RAS2]
MATIPDRSIEAATRSIGEEIFHRAHACAPSVASIEYWQQFGMSWLTRDEDLKRRLFEFIAALPSADGARRVAAELQRKLTEGNRPVSSLPPPVLLAAMMSRPASPLRGLVGAAARRGSLTMAQQFICGATAEQAIDSVRKLRRQGMAFTLDVLGEAVHDDAVALTLQKRYIELIDRLSTVAPTWQGDARLDHAPFGALPRVNLSIKLTAIVNAMDPSQGEPGIEAVLDRLRPILRRARDRGAFVNIDTEHYAIKDMTFEVFRRVLTEPEFRDWPDCGIVVQAYLRDARRDLMSLVDFARRRGTPIWVRLVKGAYWDSETADARRRGDRPPVFVQKRLSDTSFEAITGMMLDHVDVIRPAFASHNVRSIAHAMARERAMELPPRTVEFQMLTGMGNPLKRALVDMGQRLRVYAPFGDFVAGMAYLIRRLIENTANESFLRQSFDPDADHAALLASPGNADELDEPDAPTRSFKPILPHPELAGTAG